MYSPITNHLTNKAIRLYVDEITRVVHNMDGRGSLEINQAMATIRTYKRALLDSLANEESKEVSRWIDRYNLTLEHIKFSLVHEDLPSLGTRIYNLLDKINGGA